MQLATGLEVDRDALAALCRRHGITRLALFGSALRDELGPDSDVDLLVTFEPGRVPGLLGVAQIEMDLETLLGRRVELRTANDLSRFFRQRVVEEARPLYAAA